MTSPVFRIRPAGELVLCQSAYASMLQYRQKRARLTEAGGVLLGYIEEGERRIIIDSVSTPQPHDRRSRRQFYRSSDHQNIAVSAWRHSEGYCHYLGLWHTHPERTPSPSDCDKADWRTATLQGQYAASSLFFMILGTEALCCWQTIMKNTSETSVVTFKQLLRIQ